MKSKKEYQTVLVKVSLTPEEKETAKTKAKSLGYTFQGWIGNLIKSELLKETRA